MPMHALEGQCEHPQAQPGERQPLEREGRPVSGERPPERRQGRDDDQEPIRARSS